VHTFVQDGRFFLHASPRQYDIISGEPPPPKVAGSVNLYTQEFFSLMNSRLKEGGMATFWLPINQLKVNEAKAILRAFHNAFPNASVWASADEQWIMMGIKGPAQRGQEGEIGRLWSDPATNADLSRIGLEIPQQLGALFLMDAEEIDRITHDIAPLTDNYPKRLTDEPWDEQASRHFALTYMEAASAVHHFLRSPLISGFGWETLKEILESCFVFREMRYRCGIVASPIANASLGSPRFRRIPARDRTESCAQLGYTSTRNHAGFNCGSIGPTKYRRSDSIVRGPERARRV